MITKGCFVELVAGILLMSGLYTASYPLHASCRITWHFDVSCDTVLYKLQQQFKALHGGSGCAHGGQKCLYTLISDNGDIIKGTHESTIDHHFDLLTFNLTLSSQGHCETVGYATSGQWDSILDDGFSYCSLKNIITGAGLHEVRGYTETLEDATCTQHDIANCTVV